jgi:hypothetical protein
VTFEVTHALSSSSSSSKQGNDAAAAAAAAATAAVGPLPEYSISVAGHTFQLHLHSFKQYGLNEAYDRSISLLLQQQEAQALQMFLLQQGQHEVLLQQGQHEVLLQQPAGGSINDTTGAATVLVPGTVADTSSNSSSDGSTGLKVLPSAAAAGDAIKHDIAVARAASVQADPYDITTGGTAATQLAPQHLEQQRQADLAVAAAAGYHPHEAPAPLQPNSATVSSSTAQVQAELGSSNSGTLVSSSSSSAAVDSSSVEQSSSSHGGLQPVQTPSYAVQGDSSGAVQASYAEQVNGAVGPTSPGLRLQGGPSPLLPAARRRASGLVRRSLLQQQLVWLEQRLGTPPAAQQGQSLTVRSHSGSAAAAGGAAAAAGVGRLGQQHSHDVVLRQLVRDYLLRDDPAVAAPAAAAVVSNGSSSSGTDVVLSPAAEAHRIVPVNASSSSSSIVSKPAPAAVQEERPGVSASTTSTTTSSSTSTSHLPVVRHPCLHEGYEATYTRVAYAGVAPDPPQVRLHVSYAQHMSLQGVQLCTQHLVPPLPALYSGCY